MSQHPEIYEGKPFSKFLDYIKLDCLLKQSYSHSVQDLWKGNGRYFAFYHTSGLREVTPELYNRLKNNFGKKWN